MASWAEEVEREAELLARHELAAELLELHTWAEKELGVGQTKLSYGGRKRRVLSLSFRFQEVDLQLVAIGEPTAAIPAMRRLVENQAAGMWEEA